MNATRTATQSSESPQATGQPALLQRKCACGGPAGLTGQCEECGKRQLQGLQAKLTIGAPDDPFEREADRVAEQVVSGTAATTRAGATPSIQRFSTQPAGAHTSPPASLGQVLAQPGSRLEPGLRQDMESRFGHDFSQVRVHTGTEAERSTRDLAAQAFTLRNDIVFASGQFAPETTTGRRLLAHELTHVVQQSGTPRHLQRSSKKGPTTVPHSCGGWDCAATGECPKPDGKSAPSATASTSWSLTANLDLDVLTADDITGGGDVGHAFVEFAESNGDRYTYGHYPNKSDSPDPVFRPQVPGCTAHPDQTHSGCVDMKIKYGLAEADYTKALDFAKSWCIGGQPYHVLDNNCTTFVEKVVKVAGQAMPSSRGKVAHGTLTADNPNTLFDAHLSQSDNATWRQRVNGDFKGQYDAAGTVVTFKDFELKSDDKFVVAGKYTYTGSSGDEVEGSLDGRLIFNVDAATKAVSPVVKFDWSEPGGTGKGVWSVSATGDLKGTWGRGGAESGAGGWELSKAP
ncbi:hypothetical protein D9M68_327620 [compost metagenome]